MVFTHPATKTVLPIKQRPSSRPNNFINCVLSDNFNCGSSCNARSSDDENDVGLYVHKKKKKKKN